MCEVTVGTNCILHVLKHYKVFGTWNHLVGGSCRTNGKADAPSTILFPGLSGYLHTANTVVVSTLWRASRGTNSAYVILVWYKCTTLHRRCDCNCLVHSLSCDKLRHVRPLGTTRLPVQRFREILVRKIITGILLEDPHAYLWLF